jgi:dihydrofolate synthase/folylpolyglutamate synthase
MTYEQTLEFLFIRHGSTYRGLKRIRYVLEKLGNPQNTFPSVLITGTNGKGSVAKMISSVLTVAGYRVGCFTSPHLIDFRERITINENFISKDEVVELTELIRTSPLEQLEQERKELQIEGIVSFFEVVTAMAFLHFARHKVDIAILEVGIGGRLDATNTANPLVSVIINVGLDHQQFLGDTVEEIAREKSAIIREQGDVIIGCQKPEALAVIEEVCREKHATLYRTGIQQECKLQLAQQEPKLQFAQTSIPQKISPTDSIFSYQGIQSRYDDLHLSLVGMHQIANATVALGTLELLENKGFHTNEKDVRAGLSHVVHPGRLEMVHTSPRVVVDIAHNFMGASAIAHAMTSIFDYDKIIVIIGVLHDKDVQGILRPFLEIADSMIFTSPHSTYRAEAATATAQVAEEFLSTIERRTSQYDHWLIYESIEEAIQQACSIAGKHDLICITGSNYTVSETEIYFSEKANEKNKN